MTTFGDDCIHDTDSFGLIKHRYEFCEARPETKKKKPSACGLWVM